MLLIEEGNDYEDVDEADLPYSHLKNLGHGHSSIVEAVQDKVTKAIYARKTFKIPPSKTKRHEPIKVFRNEVKIIRNLGCHRHIIKVFATYTTTSNIGLILQPVADEGDLEDFLATYWNAVRDVEDTSTPNPRLDGMKLVMRHAFGCLIRGLAFMHDKKVRHKDIKPRNILIHNGRVIITDFGYSFDSNGRSRSATNGKPGPLTRKYSAIEVLQHEERDSRSDIYSLGCVFIELLSASSLVPDEFGCFSDNMHNIHQRLALWEVPSELSTLPKTITRMTMPKPSDRWCALHTAIEILRTPGLCCEDCRLNPVDPNKKCVKEHGRT
ncbi:kinase-like domain-containing protein [Pyrenochaeta sp. MPI-SDFR-AT-0127]|nr:kinase-like domain-containing protein [Pyrenochaeta sp. MPI-SDFR-AT-0127]